MRAIQHHIFGIRVTVENLMKGRYLGYFIPGIAAGLIYLWFHHIVIGWKDASDEATSGIPMVGETLSEVSSWLLNFTDRFFLEVLKFMVLVLLSPFTCILSEKFDNRLTGNTFNGGIARIIKDMFRAMFVVFIALLLEYLFMGLWLIVGLMLPDSVDPIAYFCISSFFMGFAFYDYSLERYGMGTLASLRFAFSNVAYMLFTGGLFTLIIMIPIMGVFIAPVLIAMISTATYVKSKGLVPPTV